MRCHVCDLEAPVAADVSWCRQCGAMMFAAAKGPDVLVAHGSEPLSLQIGKAVAAAGMTPLRVVDGRQAWRLVETRHPGAVVLDVALTEVLAFQLIERLRGSSVLGNTKVVLVASVFNKTAYKRRPSSLYGADDYVEQHHIVDHLPERLCRLLGLPPPLLEHVEERRLQLAGHDLPVTGDGATRAPLLARSIVADIALYRQEDLMRAARGEPSPGLEAALDEGRRMLASRLDPSSYAGTDPILDAFRRLLHEMREVKS